MSAYKDSGIWRYRKTVRSPAGEPVRISGTPQINTKPAAETLEREHVDCVLRPDKHSEEERARFGLVKRMQAEGFAMFAAEWLRTHPPAANKRSTTLFRSGHIIGHLVPWLKDKPLHEIDNLVLTQLVAHLKTKPCAPRYDPKNKDKPRARSPGARGSFIGQDKRCSYDSDQKPLSPRTVKHIMGTLHKVLSSALDWGKLRALPKFPKIAVPDEPWDWLEPADSERLLSVIKDPEDRALLLFALKTGARVGEQLAIEWGDIDWRKNQVTIRRGIYRGEEGSTKTGRERTVDLAPSLREALQRIKHLRGPKVFCGVDGAPLTNDILTGRLERYLRLAGLRRITWHDLRHTFASQLVSRGVHLRFVQVALGHTTITTTMRYAHLAPSEGAALIARLDEVEETGA
jgi:integrase